MTRSEKTPGVCRQPLRPERALTTATWITALLILGLNDHVLKHATVLPSQITGKLSDVAGMFVAPALLATLLRVRTLSGLRRAYVAVFAVFAAINLIPAASTAWTWSLGALGVPSVNVCDPTDVPFAFVAILLSWRALAPTMRPSERLPPLRPRRAIEVISVMMGVSLCVATQPKERVREPAPPPPEFELPTVDPGQVLVVTEGAVSGYVELRCTDGARQELPFQIEEPMRRHSWAIFDLGAEGSVECKLKVHGAVGSYGPVTAASTLIWCDVSPGSTLACAPREYPMLPAMSEAERAS